jgi:hypothetical protein
MVRRRFLLVALLLVAMPVAAVRVRAPVTADIDGCVMPATACPKPRDVFTMRLRDQKLQFAVDQLSIPTSSVSSSKVLTELRLRGAAVNGPAELTSRLTPGAHLRIRAIVQSGPRLLLQSIETRQDK